ncbi:DUF4868 domain-containing protein [Pantoea ananatis]|uniref:DUF4868 domain-containing protein n=1 Tax=Pantoea ananas TaxID=553 RepID=UPI00197F4F49|nr:DUF4868 domain-containing protein [Pantoea ananatis]MBN6029843.1 DUF4868 domain-containing protein [Pantoea ananatis]
MQEQFNLFKNHDVINSNVYLWVFKRSATASRFTAHYVQTAESLNEQLKLIALGEFQRITEFQAYSYLAETNENSCLSTAIAGSDFINLKTLVDRPEPDFRLQNIKDLKNVSGYVVKFINNGQTLYAIKRSAKNWKASFLKTHVNIVFRNGELSAAEDEAFVIEKNFDFYAIDTALFIANKRAFESVMEHRSSYTDAFTNLQLTASFSDLFTDMTTLINYVGNNSIQLRRMARVEEKALFQSPQFLSAVQIVNNRRAWGLNFDATTGKIIPCEQTIKTIMQILLDHRLLSEVTDVTYDVPDATQI